MGNNGDKVIRVATYARVSTQEQAAENTSLASQDGQLTAYCQMQGWTVINSYVDPGFSGKNGDRPGLKQLRSDAKIGLFDKVLVCKLDRLARNLRLLMEVESELNDCHVSLTSIKECVDTCNSTGKMVFQLFGMIAEWERDTIIERTKSGRIQRYKEGCWAGGKPPFGYSYDKASRKLIINEEQAKVVRLIFDEYNSGESLISINDLLDAKRIPTIRGKARGWIDAGIRFILINPVYKGTLIVNRKCHITNINKVDLSKSIIIKVPPIVSESVWNKAQSNLGSHKKIRRQHNKKWLLQGIISCGICGLSYQSQYRSPTKRCYACRGRLKGSHTDRSPRCGAPTFDADKLESEVWEKIADILNDPDKLIEVIKENLGNLRARQDELGFLVKPIDEKLAQISQAKARLADEWVSSNMDPGKFNELKFSLNKEEIRLKSLRANLDPSQLIELESVNATLDYWQNQFQSPDEATEDKGGGLKLLEKPRVAIKVYGFEDTDLVECLTSPALRREILEKLSVKLVVFKDRIEIRCQIPIKVDKSINLLMTLKL
jgi:site-specific DNA recombinase